MPAKQTKSTLVQGSQIHTVSSSRHQGGCRAGLHRQDVGLKTALSFAVLAFWISAWFPTSLDRWAVVFAACCFLGLITALLFQRPLEKHLWVAKILRLLAGFVLIGGGLFAFLAGAVGTSAEGSITLFFVIGLAGYLYMLSGLLTRRQTAGRCLGLGPGSLVLCLLGSWSWASALSMQAHRGAFGDSKSACIIVPDGLYYDTELTSLWDMRLAEIVSNRTGPTGTVILNYHAVLVVPKEEQTEIYNWSKRWMRFEALDLKRNPYLPTDCP
jgi:energy-converting hydrogenase Eha subunit C